jgi:hypothetical protein
MRASIACVLVLLSLCAVFVVASGSHEGTQPDVSKLTFAPQDSAQTLSVSPDVLDNISAFVTVRWAGIVNPQPYDWIAAYSPPPTSLDGFKTTLPAKYFNLTADMVGTSGSLPVWLLHMRADYVFVYVKGGFTAPTVITVSNVVSYKPEVLNVPMQIHLARTVDPTQMRVTWTTAGTQAPAVRFAPAAKYPGPMFSVSATTSTYTRDQMCASFTPQSSIAGGIGWRDPGVFHTAVIDGLQPGVEYVYQVGDFGIWSDVETFFAAPAVGSDVDFTIFGDLGQAEFDGSVEYVVWTKNNGLPVVDSDQPAALNTSSALRTDLVDGSVNRNTSIILLIGDISYARGRATLWEQFGFLMQPAISKVPMMTLLGNHEFDYNNSMWRGTDSGGECGIPTQVRFPMPSPAGYPKPKDGFSNSPWYSFAHGAVHFVMLSSEHDFNTTGLQYAWLEKELASVDRSRTPWLIVSAHRPMYVSSTSTGKPVSDMGCAALMQQQLEPLLLKYRVDLFFAGHHHSQQRTCAVAGQVCADSTSMHLNSAADAANAPSFGIVNFVVGAAGMQCNTYLSPSAFPWLLFANTNVHGYSRVRVRGRELTLDFVGAGDKEIWDSVTIVQQPGKAPLIKRNPSKLYKPTKMLQEQ